jgi:hypothetical protein
VIDAALFYAGVVVGILIALILLAMPRSRR